MDIQGLTDEGLRSVLTDRFEGKVSACSDEALFEETRRRADLGSRDMMFLLGTLYHMGIGREEDQDAADTAWVSSFEDEAEGLEAVAGSRYRGTPGPDLRRAGDLYCRASDRGGSDDLMMMAADCYLAEYMSTKDPEAGALAFGCYRYCFPDYSRSARCLALCYMYGIGTGVSFRDAEEMIRISEAEGLDTFDLRLQLSEETKRGYYFP